MVVYGHLCTASAHVFSNIRDHAKVGKSGTGIAQLVAQRREQPVNEKPKARRGFASMSAEKQREIASKGGRAAHAKGTAHEWSSGEARDAGRKGGMVSRGGRGKLPHESPAESVV